MRIFSKLYNSVIDFYMPDNTEEIDPYELAQMRLTISISVYGGLIALIMALLRISLEGLESKTWFLLFGISALAMIIPFSFKFTKRYIWWAYFLCIAAAIVVTIRAISTGGTYGQAISWFYLVPVLGSLVIGIRGAIIVTIICLIGTWTAYLLPEFGIVQIGYFTHHQVNAVVLSFGLINIGCFCVYSEYQKAKYQQNAIKMERKIQSHEKLVGLSRISSGIAHEVNNPLAVISLNLMSLKNQHSKLLKNDTIDTDFYDVLKRRTDNAINSIAKVNDTILTLKDLMQSEKLSYKPIAIKKLLETVVSEQADLIKHFNISVEIKCQNPDTEMNKLAFERVFSNLIRNSVDAISRIDIKWIKINSFFEDDIHAITITDSGAGIKKKIADRIFEPFYTTKDIHDATGLGLGLCRAIIHQVGGDIYLNEKSINTQFIIKTPRNYKV